MILNGKRLYDVIRPLRGRFFTSKSRRNPQFLNHSKHHPAISDTREFLLDPKPSANNILTPNISVYPKISSPISQIKTHYEVIVIGSGYGASVAASRLARLGKVPPFLPFFSFI